MISAFAVKRLVDDLTKSEVLFQNLVASPINELMTRFEEQGSISLPVVTPLVVFAPGVVVCFVILIGKFG